MIRIIHMNFHTNQSKIISRNVLMVIIDQVEVYIWAYVPGKKVMMKKKRSLNLLIDPREVRNQVIATLLVLQPRFPIDIREIAC